MLPALRSFNKEHIPHSHNLNTHLQEEDDPRAPLLCGSCVAVKGVTNPMRWRNVADEQVTTLLRFLGAAQLQPRERPAELGQVDSIVPKALLCP